MVFIIIGTGVFHLSSTPLEMNLANLFHRISASNEKCQHYFRESWDRRKKLWDSTHLNDLGMWKKCECLHIERGATWFCAGCTCVLWLSLIVALLKVKWALFSSLEHVDSLLSEWVGMFLIEPPWKKKASRGWKCLWASVCTVTQWVKHNPVIVNVFESFKTMQRALFTDGSLFLEAWKAARV